MNYEEALSFIHSTEWQGSRPGLTRITELLERLSNPERGLKVVHVAGTNGKGSFCAMLDSVLREAGYKTGLFTSPFIEEFEERIQYCGEPISKEELAMTVGEVKDSCLAMSDPPTEFEVITAVGFSYFKKKNVDIVILECGMGGRLDSTNVIPDPVLSVITGISLDHVAFLGDTVEKIAAEKAGIIKETRPVLYGGRKGDAQRVIKKKAAELSSPYYEKSLSDIRLRKVSVKGSTFDYKKHKNIKLSLIGTYQPENASNVIEAVEILRRDGYRITDKHLRDGLKNAKWKGRFERLSEFPPVYFDGGHNEEGVNAAVRSVRECFGKKKINIISGVLKDKDYEKIGKKISSVADCVYTVTPDSPRALDAAEYAEVIKKNGVEAYACEGFDDAVKKGYERALKNGRPLLCVGSLYSYPDFKKALKNADKDGTTAKKAKEKLLAKRMVRWVCILIAVFIALNLLFESGILNGLFSDKIKYREYPPIEDLYPADFTEDLEDLKNDKEYMSKDQFIEFTEGNVTTQLSSPEDFEAKGELAQFFKVYFDAVRSGDEETYNSLLSDAYKKEFGEKEPFTVQRIYDIEVVKRYTEEISEEITAYVFDVGYRIMMNNGTYRNNLYSDTMRAMQYVLYKYPSGRIEIFRMSEYLEIIN